MARLEIEHQRIENGTVHLIRPKGKLDVFSFGDLKVFFEALRQEDKAAKIVVDLDLTEYVASSGWSVLLGWRRMIALGNGNLVLCGVRPEVQRVYDSMKIAKLLPACADLNAAVRWLNEVGTEGTDA